MDEIFESEISLRINMDEIFESEISLRINMVYED